MHLLIACICAMSRSLNTKAGSQSKFSNFFMFSFKICNAFVMCSWSVSSMTNNPQVLILLSLSSTHNTNTFKLYCIQKKIYVVCAKTIIHNLIRKNLTYFIGAMSSVNCENVSSIFLNHISVMCILIDKAKWLILLNKIVALFSFWESNGSHVGIALTSRHSGNRLVATSFSVTLNSVVIDVFDCFGISLDVDTQKKRNEIMKL